MKNQKMWIILAGFMGLTGVALGAFGAHGLRSNISSEMLSIYKTGILYHLIHSVAMLAVALFNNSKFYKSALMFFTGIILFSFSLYLYAITGNTTFAIVTPVGGIFFLIGWLLIIIEGMKLKKDE